MNDSVRVFVYFNVRRKDFSVKALSGPQRGRVIARADVVEIMDATFVVSEAGRQKVLTTGQKNIHAGVRGRLGYFGPEALALSSQAMRVTYNPKRDTGFISSESRLLISARAARVVLSRAGCYAEA